LKDLKITFKTDKLLRSYLASDVSKMSNGKDKIVDLREAEVDMGIGEMWNNMRD
jgi:hypothetical protein